MFTNHHSLFWLAYTHFKHSLKKATVSPSLSSLCQSRIPPQAICRPG